MAEREPEASSPGTGAGRWRLLVPAPGRILAAALLALVTFAGAGAVAAASDSGRALVAASWLFFPLRLHLFFRGSFRRTIQDFTVCRFPGCDEVALGLTVALSLAVYYVAGCAIHRLVTGGRDGAPAGR